MWTTKRYNRPLIYITENGVDAPGESTMEIEVALKDDFRFIPHHLLLSLHICSYNTPSMLVIGTVLIYFPHIILGWLFTTPTFLKCGGR